ncbi:MAG: hypothetical protein J5554_12245 [Paludibacteraceae bacterium]|nr:hypothetical protein [Paludibacteraceae bacterium]
MLEIFKSSEDIYRSFEESWEYLDKKDLRKNEDLRPYFLQLLDYNKCVKNKISKRVKNKKETNVLIWDYLSETNKAGLKDTIDKSPILQKAYEDSAKIYFTDKCDGHESQYVRRKNTIFVKQHLPADLFFLP